MIVYVRSWGLVIVGVLAGYMGWIYGLDMCPTESLIIALLSLLARLGIYEEDFIEERRSGLEGFVNKIAGHPLAQNERCLHMFLQVSGGSLAMALVHTDWFYIGNWVVVITSK